MEYVYRICGVGDNAPPADGPATVAVGSSVTITDTRTHRRSRRKSKRWPHAPTKRIPLPPSDVAYYRVDRTPPLSTHTGRVLCDDESLYLPAPGEGLGNPWAPKGGRGVQLSRMFAKAQRRQQRAT